MLEQLCFPLKLIAVLGCGLIAGVFFAFSTFVMKALAQHPAAQGIATMQSINITVINPWFMTAFLGASVVCLVLIVSSLFQWQQPVEFANLSVRYFDGRNDNWESPPAEIKHL